MKLLILSEGFVYSEKIAFWSSPKKAVQSCQVWNLMRILYISKRLNSTYYVVERAIKVQNGLKNWLRTDSHIGSIKLDQLEFSDDEWWRFRSICDQLKRFEETLWLILGKKYPTLFFVMLVFVKLFSYIELHVTILNDLKTMKNALDIAHQVLSKYH